VEYSSSLIDRTLNLTDIHKGALLIGASQSSQLTRFAITRSANVLTKENSKHVAHVSLLVRHYYLLTFLGLHIVASDLDLRAVLHSTTPTVNGHVTEIANLELLCIGIFR
jgi:hypothetical protein